VNDVEQLIAQARAIHAKAMNCSDFAEEGQWRAAEDVIDPPLHNYWRVTAVRAPYQKGVGPYPVTKALTQEPGVAGLLTFTSTALPQLCDLVERLTAVEAKRADETLEVVAELYKAWPDAEDISSDWPLGIIGSIEQIIAERNAAQAALAVVRQSLQDQAAARADPTMPLLTPEVLEHLRSEADAGYALAGTREERVQAHGLSLLCDWQDRLASTGGPDGR